MPTLNDVLQQGRYRVIQESGRNINIAFDTVSRSNVVLKEISVKLGKVTTGAQLETLRHAFAAEAGVLRGLEHDSLAKVLDFFSEIDRHYLVLEEADGDELAALLSRNQSPFPISDVTNWADRLLDAISYLHTRNPSIIHLDVRPENVTLTVGGGVKLGAPRLNPLAAYSEVAADRDPDLTYVPLEQIWGGLDPASQKVISNSYDETSLAQPPDARTDIFAVGATLYHLATAHAPVNALERSIEILDGKPDPLIAPSELNESIPPEISEVMVKALGIRREDRFDTAAVMRQVLRTAILRVRERESSSQSVPARPNVTAAVKAPVDNQATEAAKDAAEQAEILRLEQEKQKIEERRLALLAEEKRLHEERMAVERRRIEFEAEQKRQAEIIARQRAEQEQDRKRFDEQRTAAKPVELYSDEAVFEGTIFESAVDVAELPITVDSADILELAPQSPSAEIASEEIDLGSMFAEQAPSRPRWQLGAAAGAVVLVAGGVYGVWSLMNSGPAPVQTSPSQAVVTSDVQPEPVAEQQVEALAADNVVVDQGNADTNSNDASVAPEQYKDTTDARPKTTSAPAPAVQNKVKKPLPQPSRPTEQKKAITVDDLINDN